MQKPQRAERLAPFLGNYLVNRPRIQNTAMSASVFSSQDSYQAITATMVDEPEITDDSERVFTMATYTFEALPIWMLQTNSECKIVEGIEFNSSESLRQSIVESASSILEDRIKQGKEPIHDVIEGAVVHVDGVQQCFIDTRNVSNGVTGCPKCQETSSLMISSR